MLGCGQSLLWALHLEIISSSAWGTLQGTGDKTLGWPCVSTNPQYYLSVPGVWNSEET